MDSRDKALEGVCEALRDLAKALKQFPKDLEAGCTATIEFSPVSDVQEQTPLQSSIGYVPGGYQPVSFDPDKYVREHCQSYIYGVPSDSDIATIESDPSLSYEEKQEVKSKLDYLSAMYY